MALATPADMNEAFWLQQCPNRGPALTHAFGRSDTPGVCAHCKQSPFGPPTPVVRQFQMPPVDVAARLRQIGFEPDDQTVNLKEAGMATGQASGPADGPGRGELTLLQRRKLVALKGWIDWQAAHDSE